MDFLEGLNPQQRQAATHFEGPLLILAGAGSGKTRVITHRIAHLVRQHQVHAASILAVTFTNKAAGEMKQRVATLLGETDPLRLPRLSTFHSFSVRLLRRDGGPLAAIRPGFTRSFTIADEDDQLAIVKGVYRHLGFDEKQFMQYRAALSAISHAKNHARSPEEFLREATDPVSTRLAVVYERYEGALGRANALDFDDLLIESVRLLRHDAPTRQAWNRRLQFVLVDEYQDTNRIQYDLMRLLSDAHENVCVVGDEDQSIYSWRGADLRNILDFHHDYPRAVVIRLEQNYRSTKNILDAASAVVARNTRRLGKGLWTDGGAGPRVGLHEAFDGEAEAVFVAGAIERALSRDPGRAVAVLYRTNSQSRQIEEALRRNARAYTVVGGFSFYQRAEVKDVLAYLKAAIAPHDSVSLARIINTPARGIGRTTFEQIESLALEHNLTLRAAIGRMLEENLFGPRAAAALESFVRLLEEIGQAAGAEPVDRALNSIIERTGYRRMLEADPSPDGLSRLENLAELVNAAAEARERGEGAVEFLDHAALVADADQIDERAEVLLLTLHNAKGLEFPYVFITGLEEGLFPHIRAVRGDSDIEEERRLCYVGMTRARQQLTLSWARQRRRYGGGMLERSIRSRFLAEIPPELVETLHAAVRASTPDLYAESHEVRQVAGRVTWPGKTLNSIDNVREFLSGRTAQPSTPTAQPAPRPVRASGASPAAAAPRSPAKKKTAVGASVDHPRYGRGMILRREGEGDDTKLTVSFPGYGLKKIVAKYAGLKLDE